MLAQKIKALMQIKGLPLYNLVGVLSVNTKQALSIKFKRNSFSASDLITVCDYLGYTLAVVDENNKIVMSFDRSDIEG